MDKSGDIIYKIPESARIEIKGYWAKNWWTKCLKLLDKTLCVYKNYGTLQKCIPLRGSLHLFWAHILWNSLTHSHVGMSNNYRVTGIGDMKMGETPKSWLVHWSTNIIRAMAGRSVEKTKFLPCISITSWWRRGDMDGKLSDSRIRQ